MSEIKPLTLNLQSICSTCFSKIIIPKNHNSMKKILYKMKNFQFKRNQNLTYGLNLKLLFSAWFITDSQLLQVS